MRVRRLVMLRHGQTEYNADSRMQGQLDTELSDLGRDQAAAAAEVLAKRQPLVIVSSDLRRALDTAVALGERCGHAGARRHPAARNAPRRLAGHDPPRGGRRAPGARLAWRDDARWAPHGGESRVDVAARSMPLVAELVAAQTEWGVDEPDRPVVLVAHGGLIAALTAALARAAGRQLAGARRHGQRQLGAAVRALRRRGAGVVPPVSSLDGIRWRLDVWNASAQVANDVL